MGETKGHSADRVVSPGAPPLVSAALRSWRWLLVALVVTGLGVAGSISAADSVASSNAARSRDAFVQSAAAVASSLRLALQRERDLVITASGFFLGDPNATTAQFRAWAASVRALKRYPELLSWGEILLVPSADVGAFVARFDPVSSPRAFTPLPPGSRRYYCFAAAVERRTVQEALPVGLDYCAGTALLAARSSGQLLYGAAEIGGKGSVALNLPFYRAGAVPRTPAARRAAFAGWIGITLKASTILEAALAGHAGIAVAFRYASAKSSSEESAANAVFRAGRVPKDAQSASVPVASGWTARTFGAPVADAVFAYASAAAVLLGGVGLSLMVGLLVLALGTGRARARGLVAEQTEELRDQSRELRYQAMHDSLTGLPNRTLIMDRIEQLLARARRTGTTGALLFVDLDEFKSVNDTLGHAAGDTLLIAAAARLQSTLRADDTVGRMGGDEFVVLINGAVSDTGPEFAAERLLDVMREPFELEPGGALVTVSTTIGIAIGNRDSAGELLRDADTALYQAKAAGRDRYAVYSAAAHTSAGNRTELEFDLRSALARDQFHLVYQPIYNLDDLTVVSVEALLRWRHPNRGLVPPDEFISVLERTGQIREVGHWVLLQACQQAARWRSKGSELAVSVNVSAVQLDGDAIVEHILAALDITGLEAGALIVEVTETALMRSADATAERLRAIKKLGVKIAVDDFGTGYSSLAYLQKFPVDCLKIDRTFIDTLTASPESRALVRTLVQLGRALGLTTLAEGVETTDQLDQLRDEEVNEVQGYLLSRPLDAATLERQILAPVREQANGRRGSKASSGKARISDLTTKARRKPS
jgi:diguanylate cyclase (GGDEF)-like protein